MPVEGPALNTYYTRFSSRVSYRVEEISNDGWVCACGFIDGKPAVLTLTLKDFFSHFEKPTEVVLY
jgi:hypothetical protein